MKKRGLLKTADNWIGANRREPQALSHKPSFSRPIQSDPSLSPPNTIQANPIRTKIVSAAYLDFEPAVKLCLHTVQFRSRSSEIWWLTTNCTAERVPVSSSVMAVWGLWDSTKVKPILGLGNEYNCERIFYMWRKKIHSWMLPISVISANSNNYTLCISWSFDFIYHLQINVQIAEKKLDKC